MVRDILGHTKQMTLQKGIGMNDRVTGSRSGGDSRDRLADKKESRVGRPTLKG